jgi:hypothetical protein
MSSPRIRITNIGGSGGGLQGDPGDSAYQIAINNGFIGTEQEWLDSLIGEPGTAGADGLDGADGADGAPGAKGDKGDQGEPGPAGADGLDGADGAPGPKGDQGDPGPAGADGADGADGAPGPKGDQGDPGPAGADGADGAQGPQGDPGIGIPTGGTGGQILAKIDDTNYSTEWIDNWATYSGYTNVLKHEVKAGVALTKGQAVYVSSADGTNMIVSKASNASEQTSSKTMGLVEESVSSNGKTNVITEGLLAGLNTNGATAGDPVWLGTNGNLIYGISNKPVAPAHLVFIGIVTRANANNGEIFIRPQNGFELNEIHDVLIGTGYSSTPANNDILSYDTSSSLWKNKTAAEAGVQTIITGGATTITSDNLTGNRALISSSGGKVAVSGVTSTELAYLTNSTGNIQTQIDNKVSAVAPLTLTQASNSASYPLAISSANQQNGGTGYADILKITNTVAGTTNPSKFFRMNNAGSFEIVNNAYSSTILFLADNGNLSISGSLGVGSYTAGQHIKTTIWSASDMGFTGTYNNGSTNYATIASKSYTPGSNSSYIFFEVYARYYVNGASEDSFFSQLTWNGIEIAAQRQYWANAAGGGTRSSTLFPIAGRVTNSGGTFTFAVNARRDSADDTLSVYADNAFYVKITEIAR